MREKNLINCIALYIWLNKVLAANLTLLEGPALENLVLQKEQIWPLQSVAVEVD